MKIVPLTGQVLIEVLPLETRTAGGIELPSRSRSPEEIQETHLDPVKPGALTGIVRGVGAWPKLRCGLALMPEYGLGAKVLIRPEIGTPMEMDSKRRLRMVRQEDILAVVKEI